MMQDIYGIEDTRKLREELYRRYQLDWMISHGQSPESLVGNFLEYASDSAESLGELATGWRQTFASWEDDCGFGGSCYACYSEFCETELLDEQYIRNSLLRDGEEKTYRKILAEASASKDGNLPTEISFPKAAMEIREVRDTFQELFPRFESGMCLREGGISIFETGVFAHEEDITISVDGAGPAAKLHEMEKALGRNFVPYRREPDLGLAYHGGILGTGYEEECCALRHALRIPEERREEYGRNGIGLDDLMVHVDDGWAIEDLARGYVITSSDSDVNVPDALCVEPIYTLGYFNNWEACVRARKDGIRFIDDIPGLEKGFYIDTPKNRELCKEAIGKRPELRIESIFPKLDEDYRELYTKAYGRPEPSQGFGIGGR